MKCWMVFGEIYGNVDYGMSHCTYLFAVCSTKEEAEDYIKNQKKIVDICMRVVVQVPDKTIGFLVERNKE